MQPKRFRYGCRLTAYSYVTGLPEETLVARIGHDGSKIVRKAREPYNHKAFHPQEIIDAIINDFLVVEIHAQPLSDEWAVYPPLMASKRLQKYLDTYNGVVEGWTKGGNFHAVARIDGKFYDPDTGKETELCGFTITEFYLVIPR